MKKHSNKKIVQIIISMSSLKQFMQKLDEDMENGMLLKTNHGFLEKNNNGYLFNLIISHLDSNYPTIEI